MASGSPSQKHEQSSPSTRTDRSAERNDSGEVSRRSYLSILQAVGGTAALGGLAGCSGDGGTPTDTPGGDGTPTETPGEGGTTTGDANDGEMEEVQLGIVPTTATPHLWLARDRGYWEERGIDVNFQNIVSGAQATPQLSAGQMDAATGALGASTFNAILQGLNIRLVASQAMNAPQIPSTFQFIVRGDLYEEGMTLQDMPDGFTCAWNTRASINDYSTGRLLQVNDMTWDDLEIVELPFPDQVPAMQSGEIDLTATTYPFITSLQQEAGAEHLLHSSSIAPHKQITGLMYGDPFVQNRPEVARGFLEGFVLGIRDFFELGYYDDTVVSLLAEGLEFPEAVVRGSTPPVLNANARLNLDDIMLQQEYYHCRGYLDDTIESGELIDQSMLDEALSNVGRLDEEEAAADPETYQNWIEGAEVSFPPVDEQRVPEGFPGDSICG